MPPRSLLSPLVHFLLVSEFSEELTVHPHRPPAAPARFPTCQDGLFLSLEEVVLQYQLALLDTSLQDGIALDFSVQISEEAKVCS